MLVLKLKEGTCHSISCDFLTSLAIFFRKPSRSSRHCLAASMFAGDSSLGDDSMEMMEIMMVSTCVAQVFSLCLCSVPNIQHGGATHMTQLVCKASSPEVQHKGSNASAPCWQLQQQSAVRTAHQQYLWQQGLGRA